MNIGIMLIIGITKNQNINHL